MAGWFVGWLVIGHWTAATRRRSCSCRRHAPLTDSPAFVFPGQKGAASVGFRLHSVRSVSS